MVVQHNMSAINTNRQLGVSTSTLSKSTEKLSSGYKVNRAGDDAAGLSISEKMRSQIRGLNKASSNAQDGVSLVQTAEGALNETHAILQRMNELATQAANDTNTSTDRASIQKEINQLTSEIDRIQSTTQFNTMNLLDGTFQDKNLQVGSLQGQSIDISIKNMSAASIGISNQAPTGQTGTPRYTMSGTTGTDADGNTINDLVYTEKHSLDVSSYSKAGAAMTAIQNAITTVSDQRSALGAIQNRLEHTIANLDTTSENTQAAESRIRDTDMAKEMVQFSATNIIQQAGQSMLAQANSQTQGVLSLLG